MKQNNQIKFGAVLSYVAIGINVLAGIIYTPWMIRQIGTSDYGLYTLSNSLITLFLVDFGLSSATSRFLSKYVAEGKQEEANNFIGVVYKLYIIVDIVILAALMVMYFSIEKIYVNLTPDELAKLKIIYGLSALYAIISFPFVTLNGILTSYEKFIQLKLADIIYRLFFVGFTVFALCMGMGLYALVIVNVFSGLCIIVYKIIIIKGTTPIRVNFKCNDKSFYKPIFKFTFFTTIATLAQRLIFNVTPSILGIVANSKAIAVFGVVSTIEGYTYIITTAINGMFMPKVSRIYANDKDKNIMPIMIKVGSFQFAINMFVVVAFALLGETFIKLWMGDAYSEAYIGILLVIIPGIFYNSLNIATTAMEVQNKVKIIALITVAVGCINVGLSSVLSKFFGVIGACISIFVAYMIRALICHIVYKKILKLDMLSFVKNCYIRIIVPVIFTLIFGVVLNYLIPQQSWLCLIGKGIVLVIIYATTLIVFCLSKDERNKILHSRG